MTEDMVSQAVERAEREILEDVRTGRVPGDVRDFARLHDHVDANEYGGLTEEGGPFDLGPDAVPGLDFDAAGEVQDRVHKWLADGGIADALASDADAAAARYAAAADRTISELPRIVHDQATNDLSVRLIDEESAAFELATRLARAAADADPADRGRAAVARAFETDGGTFAMPDLFDGDALEYGRAVLEARGESDGPADFRRRLAEEFDASER